MCTYFFFNVDILPLCFLTELHCPAVPMWIDYNISTKDTAYRTVMNYSCADEDYKFPDEAPYKTAECNATGLWAPPFVECASKLTFCSKGNQKAGKGSNGSKHSKLKRH